MGARMNPSYANLFVGYAEAQIFSQFPGLTSELYGCYIKDCIGVTSLCHGHLDSFLSFVPSFTPAFEFFCTIPNSTIKFPDISIRIHHSALAISILYKHTVSHSYLDFSSFHPTHTKFSITYS